MTDGYGARAYVPLVHAPDASKSGGKFRPVGFKFGVHQGPKYGPDLFFTLRIPKCNPQLPKIGGWKEGRVTFVTSLKDLNLNHHLPSTLIRFRLFGDDSTLFIISFVSLIEPLTLFWRSRTSC
jgi:hypothetical protein